MLDPCTLLLEAKNIGFGYRSENWILKNLSFSIRQGSFTMLTGSSGSGKTTLLKILAGFLKPQQGSLDFQGQKAVNGGNSSSSFCVGYIPQQLGLIRNLSVLENVLIGTLGRNKNLAAFFGFFPKADTELAKDILSDLGIAHKCHEKVICLSGGERQRVAIARTLIQKPRLVLADEFVSDLDFETAVDILNLVRNKGREQNVTFLLSMHDRELVRAFGSHVLRMEKGGIFEDVSGEPDAGQVSVAETCR